MINNTFDKAEFLDRLEQFKKLFDRAVGEDRTYSMFYDEIDVDPIYMQHFLNGRNSNFPNPKIIRNIVEKSYDKSITYDELYRIAGFAKRELERPSDFVLKRGQIYLVDLGEGVGSEQSGLRPAALWGSQKGLDHSSIAMIIPITGQLKTSLPTHVLLGQDCGLDLPVSTLLLEQVRTVSKLRIKEYIGEINEDDFKRINKAYKISGGVWGFEDEVIEKVNTIQNEEASVFRRVLNSLIDKYKKRELIFDK